MKPGWARISEGTQPRAGKRSGVLKDYRSWTSYTGVFATQSYRDVVDTVVDGAIARQRVPVTRFVTVNCAGI